MKHLKTPLGDEVLILKAGEMVTLSGTVYTARDEAHMKIMEDGFPFDPKGAVIYHFPGYIREQDCSRRTYNLCKDEQAYRIYGCRNQGIIGKACLQR